MTYLQGLNTDWKEFGPIKSLENSDYLNNAKYFTRISSLMSTIRANIPPYTSKNSSRAVNFDIRDECFKGKNYKRAVIYLLSNGCEWARKSACGCTMCGHLTKQTRSHEPLNGSETIEQIKREFKKIDFNKIPILNLYNNGSFYNPNEIPSDVRTKILQIINSEKYINTLVVESRPEFINEEVIKETRRIIPEKRIEIAIGLETVDDFARIISINKGFNLKQFDEAAAIISKYDLNLRVYVLLKPPFFSEKEAILEAIRTIKYAFSAGAATVSLEAVTVQPYTLTEYLFSNGLYELPWLWSIVEVIRETYNLGKICLGLFQFYPPPNYVPHNCAKCSDKIFDGMNKYNQTLDINSFEGISCECSKIWEQVLESSGNSFFDNIRKFKRHLDTIDILETSSGLRVLHN